MFIKKDKKINTLISYWLSTSLILVFTIIVIGGLTRLTNSGLSIIEWELFKGILPPLNEEIGIYILKNIKQFPNTNYLTLI